MNNVLLQDRQKWVLLVSIASVICTSYACLAEASTNTTTNIIARLLQTGDYEQVENTKPNAGWTILSVSPTNSAHVLILQVQTYTNVQETARAFFKNTITESSGGMPSSLGIGDEKLKFGSKRFMVRESTVLFMVYPRNESEIPIDVVTNFVYAVARCIK